MAVDETLARLKSGSLSLHDFYWHEGLPTWIPLAKLKVDSSGAIIMPASSDGNNQEVHSDAKLTGPSGHELDQDQGAIREDVSPKEASDIKQPGTIPPLRLTAPKVDVMPQIPQVTPNPPDKMQGSSWRPATKILIGVIFCCVFVGIAANTALIHKLEVATDAITDAQLIDKQNASQVREREVAFEDMSAVQLLDNWLDKQDSIVKQGENVEGVKSLAANATERYSVLNRLNNYKTPTKFFLAFERYLLAWKDFAEAEEKHSSLASQYGGVVVTYQTGAPLDSAVQVQGQIKAAMTNLKSEKSALEDALVSVMLDK